MAMTLVSTVTVGAGGVATIEFANIPQTGKDLLLVANLRTNAAAIYSSGGVFVINSDTTNDYVRARLRAISGTTVQGNAATNPSARDFEGNGNNATTSIFGNSSLYFTNYTSTTTKIYNAEVTTENNATDGGILKIQSGSYATSSPITNLKLTDSVTILEYSSASLYIIS